MERAASEAERIRAELVAQRAAGSARAKELDDRGRELAGKEALLRDREAALDGRDTSSDRERKQLTDLYSNLQAEMEKIANARKAFDGRIAEAEKRERELALREQSSGQWADELRAHDASISERETAMAERETAGERRGEGPVGGGGTPEARPPGD